MNSFKLLQFHYCDQHDCKTHGNWAHAEGLLDLSDVEKNYPEKVKGLRETIAAIDSVHGSDPELDRAPVEIWGNLRGAHGAYDPREKLIKISEETPYPEFTLVHEYGHHISVTRNQDWNEFLSDIKSDENLNKWWEAAKKTPQYQRLLKTAEKAKSTGDKETRGKMDYLLNPMEVFARSYSQWLAHRSGNLTLLAQYKQTMEAGKFLTQWTPEQHEEMGKALDDYFRSKGLLK